MNNEILLIVLFAAVAALFGLRLFMVLGERTDEDMSRQPQPLADPGGRYNDQEDDGEDEVHFTGPGAATMHDIREVDGAFDPDVFLLGARQAYVMVGEAFAAGDRDALRPLLNEDVFAQWSAAIDARAAHGHTQTFAVQNMASAEIDDVEFDGTTAKIDVEFEADIVAVTSNSDGEAVQGEPDVARRVHEIWSFERDVTSSDPAWVLTQVRAN